MRLGLCGCGNVGGGVVRQLKNCPDIDLVYIYLRRRERPSDIAIEGFKIVSEYAELLQDDTIDAVAECIGGNDVAWCIIRDAIHHNKLVVTANKDLLAHRGEELTDLLRDHPRAALLCEAAVCGGVPVIAVLSRFVRGVPQNKCVSIRGIVNGTANWILDELFNGTSTDPQKCLLQAKDLGIAEQNPANDIEGIDAVYKLCILAKCAFNWTLRPADITTYGISSLRSFDVQVLKARGDQLRLIGYIGVAPVGRWVFPVVVAGSSQFAQTRGCENMVDIETTLLGNLVLKGKGAGRKPTANSVVADLLCLKEFVPDTTPKETVSNLSNKEEVPVSQSRKVAEYLNFYVSVSSTADASETSKIVQACYFYIGMDTKLAPQEIARRLAEKQKVIHIMQSESRPDMSWSLACITEAISFSRLNSLMQTIVVEDVLVREHPPFVALIGEDSQLSRSFNLGRATNGD